MNLRLVTLVGAMALGTAAMAQVGVDGAYGAEWAGIAPKHVTHSDTGPYSAFGSYTDITEGAGYDVYLRGDATYLYGLINVTDHQSSAPGNFANLYFDLNPAAADGSDFGIEVTNNRSFIPGDPLGRYFDLTGALTQVTNSNAVEFALKWSYLEDGNNTDVTYYGAGPVSAGDRVTMRISQAFGYAPAGGPTYGDERFGGVTVEAVPEPASVAALGIGVLAFLRRRRASK